MYTYHLIALFEVYGCSQDLLIVIFIDLYDIRAEPETFKSNI